MLKKDKLAFEDFVSSDTARQHASLAYFDSLCRGHFEDHPLSRKMVQGHLERLIQMWEQEESTKTKDWIVQFIADAGVANQSVRPIILSGLRSDDCSYLPTLLYLVGYSPDLFPDIGPELAKLAKHPDVEVRWRVAWVISNMKIVSDEMRAALQLLELDTYPTTRLYVHECKRA